MASQQSRRATLFVGALALEALAPALASGADIVCVDLEDAVPPDRKAQARAAVVDAVRGISLPAGVQLVARVNAMSETEGPIDVHELLDTRAFGGLLLPKVAGPDEIRRVAGMAEVAGVKCDLYAIIETTEGLERCMEIALAHPTLKALYFGGYDLSTALGCEMAWEPLLYARSRVVHAAAHARIEAIDSPFADVADIEALKASCTRVKALGMSGRCAKHASQVAAIVQAFTPTEAEIRRAKDIVALFRADPTRPLVYEGKLVELPAIKRLERIAQLN